MIKVEFFGTPVNGFSISGHAGYAVEGADIVCAAVSSAAYMTVNTVTDVLNITPATLSVDDGNMYLKLDKNDAQKCSDVMKGFVLHIRSLEEQYKQYITVTISEV